MKKRSLSVGWLLVVAAAGGLGLGALIAGSRPTEEEGEAMLAEAEAEIDRKLPMGAPERVDSMAPDPRSLDGIPPYPGAQPRKLTDVALVMGMPLLASWFTTPDEPRQILNFYSAAYADAGVFAVGTMFNERVGYVGWLEEEDVDDGGIAEGVMHLVSIVKNSESSTETMVFLSASRPQRLLDGSNRLPPGIVFPTNIETPQMVEMAMEGRPRRIITTKRRGELKRTVDEIVDLMKRDGWRVEDVMNSETSHSFIGRKNGMSQTVSAAVSAGGTEVSLMYSLEQERKPAP